jgi:hypothetical protein
MDMLLMLQKNFANLPALELGARGAAIRRRWLLLFLNSCSLVTKNTKYTPESGFAVLSVTASHRWEWPKILLQLIHQSNFGKLGCKILLMSGFCSFAPQAPFSLGATGVESVSGEFMPLSYWLSERQLVSVQKKPPDDQLISD